MAYDYNSRTKWEKERIEKWNAEHQKKLNRLSKEKKEIFDEVRSFSNYPHCGFPVINKWGREKVKAAQGKTLKEIIYDGCPEIIDILVPEQYRGDFDYMLDHFAAFQYSKALFRPTVRTADPGAHILDAFGLMQAYKVLGIYGISPLEYLTEKRADGESIDPELLDFKRSDSFARDLHMAQFEDILAARIDRGDNAVIEAVREAILSDNNTVMVTVPLIRGIVKSKNHELHELLARFLVAARLQEGVRQAVCENADCGRAEAFLTILKAICDNDLLRFSAVKRAIATWTGICNLDSMDRISAKLLDDINEAVNDRAKAVDMTRTDDSMKIVTGLWALGFYEAQDAVDRMLEIVETGTKNQRLTISYYNRFMQYSPHSEKAANKMIETYPDDRQMAAAFMPTYHDAVDTVIRHCIRDENNKLVYSTFDKELKFLPLKVSEIFDSEEQARLHYGILKNLADGMKKRKIEFSPMIFPWYGTALDKSDLTQRMVMIAYALQDMDLIDEVCLRLTDITDSYYNTRWNYLCVLLHDPKTKIQKDALIDYVADKESYTRNAAWQMLKRLPLTQEDVQRLEKHLRLKNEETRRHVISLLEEQKEPELVLSIRRLLASDKEQIRLAGLDMLKRRSEASDSAKKDAAALLAEVIPDSESLTDKEKVLYSEIAGSTGAADILNTKGYGLYDPSASYEPVLTVKLDAAGRESGPSSGEAGGTSGTDEAGKKTGFGRAAGFLRKLFAGAAEPDEKELLKEYFSLSETELDGYFDRIRAFVIEHGKLEYTSANGDKQLLENGLYVTNYDYKGEYWTRYPFPELWDEVYDTIIKDPKVFFNLQYAIETGFDETTVKDMDSYRKAEKTILGNAWSGYHYNDPKYISSHGGHSIYQTIFGIISSRKHLVLPSEVARAAVLAAIRLPEEIRWMEKVPSRYENYLSAQRKTICFLRTNNLNFLRISD